MNNLLLVISAIGGIIIIIEKIIIAINYIVERIKTMLWCMRSNKRYKEMFGEEEA